MIIPGCLLPTINNEIGASDWAGKGSHLDDGRGTRWSNAHNWLSSANGGGGNRGSCLWMVRAGATAVVSLTKPGTPGQVGTLRATSQRARTTSARSYISGTNEETAVIYPFTSDPPIPSKPLPLNERYRETEGSLSSMIYHLWIIHPSCLSEHGVERSRAGSGFRPAAVVSSVSLVSRGIVTGRRPRWALTAAEGILQVIGFSVEAPSIMKDCGGRACSCVVSASDYLVYTNTHAHAHTSRYTAHKHPLSGKIHPNKLPGIIHTYINTQTPHTLPGRIHTHPHTQTPHLDSLG